MGSKKMIIRTLTGEEVEASKTRMILNQLSGYRRRKIVTSSAEFERRVSEFFAWCTENEVLPTIEALSSACGTTRQTIFRWSKGTYRGEDTEYRRIATAAIQAVRAATEIAGQEGILSPPIAIFALKAHGWSDTKPLEDLAGYAPEEIAAVNPKALLADYKSEYGIESGEDLNTLADAFMDIKTETVELPEWLEDGDYDA